MATSQTLPRLLYGIPLWRIEKLPLAEIKERLRDAGLSANGTKRTLAKELWENTRSLPESSDEEESGDEENGAASEASDPTRSSRSSSRSDSRGEAAGPHTRSPRDRPRRRTHSGAALTTRDLRAIKALLPQRSPRRRADTSRSSSSTPRRRSPSSSPTLSRSSASGSASSSRSSTPPRRGRRHRRQERRRVGSCSRSGSRRRSRASLRRRHHRSHRRGRRGTGSLPPILSRIKGRIRRGEYVELDKLLQANLTKASGKRGRSDGSAKQGQRQDAVIANFPAWAEAWSVYASVVCSLYPHLAPRLFQYQHFLTLKSQSFQPRAWLRHDMEFRLKLAANNSWRFHAVDTELWASCFAADGLAQATAPPLACYSCGSTTHLYAACPQRRVGTNRTYPVQRQDPSP